MARSSAPERSVKTLFVTGTDTGVGKTLLTALLLSHLRQAGRRALAIKPFCSGDRQDAHLFHALQRGDLSLDQINPFYFPQPLAPWIASRMNRRRILPADVLDHIGLIRSRLLAWRWNSIQLLKTSKRESNSSRLIRKRSPKPGLGPALLVEGVGGIMVPLAEEFYVLDLLRRVRCRSIVVARNQLGTINHTLCTVKVMQDVGVQDINVVLMGVARSDLSARSNQGALAELLAPIRVFSIPFLGKKTLNLRGICSAARKLKKSLALLAN